jgi:hypothetical protein
MPDIHAVTPCFVVSQARVDAPHRRPECTHKLFNFNCMKRARLCIGMLLVMRALATFAWSACLWQSVSATTLQKLTLDELAAKSTAIIRARVISSRGSRRGTDVFTLYELETVEMVKGQYGRVPGQVAVPGGIAEGIRQVVAGAPVLKINQEYVLFLWTGHSGLTQLTGLSQGMFMVTRGPSGDVIASRAMASERMLDGSGHPARSEPVAMPWSELKAKLVEALSTDRAATAKR